MAAVEKVENQIADALAKGGTLLSGGHRHSLGASFFEPTVIGGVTADMLVTKEETFAPFAPLIRFEDENDVLKQANNTEFGLASYFYTKDLARAWRIAEELESGMVGINTGALANEAAPFGGMKQSGMGREGSSHGIEDYLEIKYVSVAGL
jgi:succinate-semialdehyde dehydrogenase/glutarate-semialdehyde dehydrogenase